MDNVKMEVDLNEEVGLGLLYEVVGRITRQAIKQKLLPSFDDFEEEGPGESSLVHFSPNDEVEGLWSTLNEALNEELKTKKKGEKRKKIDYRGIIQDVEQYAESTSFSNDKLSVIWKLVSHPEASLNCTQRKALLFSMVPSEKVSADLIENIVSWLERAAEDGSKQSVILTVYQLLNLYAANELTESDAISQEIVLNRIIASPINNTIIPWKMLLFRNTRTPKTVSNYQLNSMEDLLERSDIKKTQIGDVKGSLMVAEEATSYTAEEQQEVTYAVKLRELKYPRGVMERFEVCKARMETEIHIHPLTKLIFLEQLPSDYSEGKLSSETPMGKLLKLLETKEGIIELTCSPKMLEIFEGWLLQFMDSRLNPFCAFAFEEDLAKYHFIFDLFYGISYIRQEGLPAVNQWLVSFACCWDFETFGGAIYRLIPFLRPTDILEQTERKELLGHLFVEKFACSQDIRLNLWKALAHLFYNWMGKFFESEFSDANLQQGLKWLHSTLNEFVTSVLVTAEVFDAVENQELVYNILVFYSWVHEKCSVPEQTMIFTSAPCGLTTLIHLSKSPDVLRMAEFLVVASIYSEEGGAHTESSKLTALGLDSLLYGVLEPQICALLPDQLLERRDEADSVRSKDSAGKNETANWCWFKCCSPTIEKNLNKLAIKDD